MLNRYDCQAHNHPIGVSNIKYTHLSRHLKTKIEMMFEMGFSYEKVWEAVSDPSQVTRDSLICPRDVREIMVKVHSKKLQRL